MHERSLMSCIDNEPVCMAGNPHDYVSMIGHQVDLLGQSGWRECCSDCRPGERMGAISENAASSDGSHDVRMSLR